MKNHTKVLSVLLAIIMAVSATIVVPFGAAETDVSVPVGVPESYTDIQLDDRLTATISNGGEHAYFRFIPEKDTLVNFYSESDYDTYGYLYDADMNYLDSNDDSGSGRNFSISYYVETGKTYYFAAGFCSDENIGEFTVCLEEQGEWAYNIGYDELNDCESCFLTGYYGSDENVEIPSEIDGHTIDRIGGTCFSGRQDIKSVVIPDTVTGILYSAFYGSSVEEFTIPDSVSFIGEWAFDGTPWLENQPDGVVYAGKNAYTYKGTCPQTLTLEDDTVSIVRDAFRNSENLTSVTIPDSVTTIGSRAFEGCQNLATLTIGSSVKTIESEAFFNCPALKSVTIPESVTSIESHAFGFVDPEALYDYRPVNGFTIEGARYSAAQYYAENNDFTFIAVDPSEIHPGDTVLVPRYTSVYRVFRPEKDCFISAYANAETGGYVTAYDENMEYMDDVHFGSTMYTLLKAGQKYYLSFYHWDEYNDSEITFNAEYPDDLPAIKVGDRIASDSEDRFTCRFIPDEDGIYLLSPVDSDQYYTEVSVYDNDCHYIGTYLSGGELFSGKKGETYYFSVVNYDNQESYATLTSAEGTIRLNEEKTVSGTSLLQFTAERDMNIRFTSNAQNTRGVSIYDPEMTRLSSGGRAASASVKQGETYLLYSGSNDDTDYQVKVAETGNFRYEAHEDDMTASITGCVGATPDELTIPEKVDGLYTVTDIVYFSFRGCGNIKSLKLPSTLKTIGNYSFSGTSIETLDLPDSVIELAYFTFWNCINLKDVNFPSSLKSIGRGSFENTALETVEIPDSVTWLGDRAFFDCEHLTSATLSKSLKRINESTFASCPALTSIDIPEGVTWICDGAFRNDAALATATLPDSLRTIKSFAFIDCPSLDTVTVPASVSTIESYALGYRSEVSHTASPDWYDPDDGYDEINYYPIEGFTIKGYDGTAAETYATENGFRFISLGEAPELDLPDFEYEIKSDNTASIIYYYGDDADVTVPATIDGYTVTEINGTFRNKNVTNVTIPNTVTKIGPETFLSCTDLTSVNIPDSVSKIGARAFYHCSALTEVDLPDSIVSIEEYTFDSCTAMMSIDIPESVTRINYGAFNRCTALESIDIPDSVTYIGEEAFGSCTSLATVTLPNDIDWIRPYTFFECSSLESIEIPEGVTKIGEEAFFGCSSLSSVTLPNSIQVIYYNAFYDCETLKSITIPASLNSIYGEAVGYYTDDKNLGVKVEGFTIYGYRDTLAEYHATKNSFIFIPLDNVTDEATGVTASLTDNVELKVEPIADSALAGKLPEGVEAYAAYDITLLKNGEEVQPDNIVTVKIPCNNPNMKVYRLEADGSLTDMHAVYIDGYMVFKTPHFTEYILSKLPEASTFTVSGTITSYINSSNVSIQVLKDNKPVIFPMKGNTKTVGNAYITTYEISNVPAGTYTMNISKANHVTRTYQFTVGTKDIELNAQICPIGDANLSGVVDMRDYAAVYKHVMKTKMLEGYALDCANANGKGDVDMRDYAAIYKHVMKTALLF